MMRHALLLAVLVLALPLGSEGARAQPAPTQCAAPSELLDSGVRLPELAKRLHARQPITIVAIGGASTAGTAAGDGEGNAYPRRLEEALQRRHPGVPITVINKGVPRQTTDEMVARFPSDVFALHPTLVIWETGTVDAVRSIDVEGFAEALESGIAALLRQHAEIMLVDMQYNPKTSSLINFEPYLDTLHRTADLQEVYSFRRYDLMRYWSDSGRFDLVDVPNGRQAALAGEIYRCLGERMADAIDHAAR